MRVVVTGATGNVGTSLLRRLGADPSIEHVLGLARRQPDPVQLRDAGLDDPKIGWAAVDVFADGDALARRLAGADVVVHLAWLFHPSHRPDMTWRNNVRGTEALLDAVAEAEVPALLAASSVAAYRGKSDGEPVDESWPTDGASAAAYAREKAYVERLLDLFEIGRPGCRLVRMRPAFIFKQGSAVQQRRLFGGPFVPTRLVRRGRTPVLPLPADLRLQVVHTEDVAQAYQLAITSSARGAFNLATSPTLSAHDLADLMGARLLPVPACLVRATMSAAWRAHVVPAEPALWDALVSLPEMDSRRAQEELGWQPAKGAQETLEEFLRGVAEGSGGATPPLDPKSSGPARIREIASGVGHRP